MRNLCLVLLAIVMTSMTAIGQNVQINGVKNRFYSGCHSIEDFGYYTIYQSEKLKNTMVQYNLEIFDLDLNQISNTPIIVRKTDMLLGAEFNGESFMFAFADYASRTTTTIVLDKEGKEVSNQKSQERKAAAVGGKLYPARDGSGFYLTSSVKEKKWGYRIRKLDNEAKVLWEKTVTRDKGWSGIAAAESAEGRLVVISIEKKSLTSRKAYGKLVAFDDLSGDKIYEYPLYNGTVTASPTSLLIEEDGTVVTCGMYFEGEKWSSTNSDGVFFLKIDPKGEMEAFNTIDWANGIQEALKSTSRKFSIGSKPKVMFHEIVKDPDGTYQIVAETFRKTVKAGTVLGMAGGGQAPPMGFTVMDFVVFNYDGAGQPIDINKIEKPYKSTTVDGAIASQGGVVLSQFMKQLKMFTYEFTTELESSGEQVIVFTNFEDAKLGAGDPYLGITTIGQGQESRTRKIPLTKKFTSFTSGSKNLKSGAMRGPKGKVCLYLYDRKKKTVSMALEDLAIE